MIKDIKIENFKCFENIDIPIKSLTLLCGLNGMGKSSLIQSILMLRQSWMHDMLKRNEVMLNGELVHLGQSSDIFYEDANNDSIKITINEENTTEIIIQFGSDLDLLDIKNIQNKINENSVIFSDDFHYLKAERLGPRTSSIKEDFSVVKQKNIGESGEFVSHFMLIFGGDKISSDRLLHQKAKSNTLKANVEAWMSEVSPGIQIKYEDHLGIDQVSTKYKFTNDNGTTSEYRATNVGFGITYSLSVVVCLLAAKPGSLVIIENPEAHLHPKGQRKIGELIAIASSIGIQVIFETHSDHVLNGVRIAVKEDIINSSDCAFHYFDRCIKDGQLFSQITSPSIDNDGRFSHWPNGFFDEWDDALDKLL